MAFSQVQTSTPANGTGSSVAVTLSATTVGDIVVVSIYMAGNTETCTSVTDDKSNTYVVQAAVDSTVNERLYQAYGVQVTGGATTVTANFSASTVAKRVFADEYGYNTQAWTSNATAFDTSTTGTDTNPNGAATAVATLTALRTGELIVATIIRDNNRDMTAGTNYTRYGGDTGIQKVMSEYRLSGAATETAPSAGGNATDTWAERATAFRDQPGASVTINPDSPNPGDNIVTGSDATNRYSPAVPKITDTITDSDSVRGSAGFKNQSKNSTTWSNKLKS